jgi:hypothetical protein
MKTLWRKNQENSSDRISHAWAPLNSGTLKMACVQPEGLKLVWLNTQCSVMVSKCVWNSVFPSLPCFLNVFACLIPFSSVWYCSQSVMTSLYSSQIRGGANGGRDPRAEAGGQLRPRRRVWRGKREETTGGGRG